MRISKSAALGVAALSAAGMAVVATVGAEGAGASTPGNVPTVTVHMYAKSISLSTGSTMHAGRTIFRVVTPKGDHELQIARLHKGYTLQQAGADLNKAFSGDVAAIRRVDSHITFRGGVESRPNHPGKFSTVLTAGSYVFTDQNSNVAKIIKVTGTPPVRKAVPRQSSITAFSYGFGTSSNTIPASGWTRIGNRSDQPHFVVFNHVKAGTTAAMVRKYFKSGSEAPPAFALRASTSSGVISPYHHEVMRYNLPAGKYLIACFWPDDDTGMPHAYMGMWKLIWLK
jgi:hypothetical protein